MDEESLPFLHYGLEKVGFNRDQIERTNMETNKGRFVAYFGVSPLATFKFFQSIEESNYFEKKTPLPHFFLCLVWLKGYLSESLLAGMFKLNENTVREWIWKYAKAIQSLKQSKVRTIAYFSFLYLYVLLIYTNLSSFIQISLDLEEVTLQTFLYTVDCTHCRIQEPRHEPDKKWFSQKLGKPALSYEVAIHLYKNKVAWTNGPFKAGEHDLTIYRAGLKGNIPADKLLIADRGYVGEKKITTPNDFDTPEVNEFKRRARARQESFLLE